MGMETVCLASVLQKLLFSEGLLTQPGKVVVKQTLRSLFWTKSTVHGSGVERDVG